MPPLLLPLPLLISLPSHSFSCYILLPGYSVRGGGGEEEGQNLGTSVPMLLIPSAPSSCPLLVITASYSFFSLVKYHANPRVSLPTTRALGGRKKAGRTETLGTRLQTLFLFSCSSCHLRGVLPLTLSLPISHLPAPWHPPPTFQPTFMSLHNGY